MVHTHQSKDLLTEEESRLLWENITRNIKHNLPKRNNKVMLSLLIIHILLSLMIAGVLQYLQPTIYLAAESSKPIILPDKSHVELLKGAQLTVNRNFGYNNREVFLKGNAIFHVTKSESPFVVYGQGYLTTIRAPKVKITQGKKSFKVDSLTFYRNDVRED